jgi:hypothetical protein
MTGGVIVQFVTRVPLTLHRQMKVYCAKHGARSRPLSARHCETSLPPLPPTSPSWFGGRGDTHGGAEFGTQRHRRERNDAQ